ncbi:hypothetical protein D1872_51080 [compost metagenome]
MIYYVVGKANSGKLNTFTTAITSAVNKGNKVAIIATDIGILKSIQGNLGDITGVADYLVDNIDRMMVYVDYLTQKFDTVFVCDPLNKEELKRCELMMGTTTKEVYFNVQLGDDQEDPLLSLMDVANSHDTKDNTFEDLKKLALHDPIVNYGLNIIRAGWVSREEGLIRIIKTLVADKKTLLNMVVDAKMMKGW